MTGSDPVKQAWAASAPEPAVPDLATARTGADKFYRRIRRRNAVEYAACVLVMLGFGVQALTLSSQLARIGAAIMVFGAVVVAWQLRRRASAVSPPDAAAAAPILVHQRAQLARQRDALASVLGWYLGPLIPGLLVMMTGRMVERGPHVPPHQPIAAAVTLAVTVLLFGATWALNQRAARKLQAKIDEIDALMGEGR